jgi:hypothetical protein
MARRMTKNRKTLSKCARLYAQALIDPTSEAARHACVPSGFPVPSQKTRVFLRGTMTVAPNNGQTTGVANGFISMCPTFANDFASPIQYTNGTQSVVGTPLNATTGIDTWVTANGAATGTATFGTLPYATAILSQQNGQVDARLVCGGIRIRYLGTDDARNGLVTSLEETNHNTATGQTFTALHAYEAAHSAPVRDGSWHKCYWSGPSTQPESEYVSNPTPWAVPRAVLVILVEANVGTLFEWEAWETVEYSGSLPRDKTMSDSDVEGFAQVLSAAKTIAQRPGPVALGEVRATYEDVKATLHEAYNLTKDVYADAKSAWSFYRDVYGAYSFARDFIF